MNQYPIDQPPPMHPDEYRARWGEDPDINKTFSAEHEMTDKDCDLLRVALWHEIQKRNRLN